MFYRIVYTFEYAVIDNAKKIISITPTGPTRNVEF